MVLLKKPHFPLLLSYHRNIGREITFSGIQILLSYLHIFKRIEKAGRTDRFLKSGETGCPSPMLIFFQCFTLDIRPFDLGTWAQVSRLLYCFPLPLDRNMMFDFNINNIGHEKANRWFQLSFISL